MLEPLNDCENGSPAHPRAHISLCGATTSVHTRPDMQDLMTQLGQLGTRLDAYKDETAITVKSVSSFPEPPCLLHEAMAASHESVQAQMVTMASRPYLIEHINKAWTALCGWEPVEALGETPKSLGMQGKKTSEGTLEALHASLPHSTRAREITSCRLINYLKDGRCVELKLEIEPLIDAASGATFFLGSITPLKWLPSLDAEPWSDPRPKAICPPTIEALAAREAALFRPPTIEALAAREAASFQRNARTERPPQAHGPPTIEALAARDAVDSAPLPKPLLPASACNIGSTMGCNTSKRNRSSYERVQVQQGEIGRSSTYPFPTEPAPTCPAGASGQVNSSSPAWWGAGTAASGQANGQANGQAANSSSSWGDAARGASTGPNGQSANPSSLWENPWAAAWAPGANAESANPSSPWENPLEGPWAGANGEATPGSEVEARLLHASSARHKWEACWFAAQSIAAASTP